MAGLGLICFVFAMFLGLTVPAIVLTTIVLALPLVALNNSVRRQLIQKDVLETYRAIHDAVLNPRKIPFGYVSFYIIASILLWLCFRRAMIELPEGYYTGLLNNFGDLPFHISVITSFALGNNYPPQDPTFAGVKFTYPFLTDFISAIFVNCGASIRQSMFLENYPVALAFVGLLHRWAFVLLRNRLAAVLTPVLVILNGGLGWVMFADAAVERHDGFVEFLKSLPVSFTIIPESTWRWGSAISTLLIPQRGFLLGLPLAVIVFTQWWLSGESETAAKPDTGKTKQRKTKTAEKISSSDGLFPLSPPVKRMIGAGIVAGLIPLVHAHSFVSVMMVGAGIALLERRWRHWFAFFAASSVVALPQLWWSTHNSAVDASTFFQWQVGWDRGQEDVIWFWLKNTGLFIPLTI